LKSSGDSSKSIVYISSIDLRSLLAKAIYIEDSTFVSQTAIVGSSEIRKLLENSTYSPSREYIPLS